MGIKITCLFVLVPTVLCHLSCDNRRSSNKQVFRYNESSNIATLDPAFAKNQSVIWAVHQLYNTLVETTADLHIVPSLAKRWELSDDRLLYRFYIRDDVFFHNGRRMTARDVEYSFKRIIDPATASPGAWIFNTRVDSSDGFRAVNDTVFELRLVQPFTPLLGLLSMPYCSIVPREEVLRHGKDFRRYPCGTGPFRMVSWDEGQALILQKNEQYFERDAAGRSLPYLDAVKISFNASKATEFLLFRQGQIDFINDIEASFKDEILNRKGQLKKEWEGKIVLARQPYLNTEYLGILLDSSKPMMSSSPLRWKKIRQAINYGFDRRKMVMYLRNSIGTPAESGFVPAGLPSFDSSRVKGYSYDPQRAAALLREAGFPEGKGLPPIKLLTIPVYAELASFIARELENLGITIRVEVVQKSLLLEQTAKSEAPFFRASWIADYPDAENYLGVFYSKNPSPPNYTRYNNPEFDRLYEQALAETDDSVRYELYRKMDQLVMDDAAVVPLWYDEIIHLVQPGIEGFHPHGLNLLELRRVRFSKN